MDRAESTPGSTFRGLTDRENDLVGRYGQILEMRTGLVGRESELRCPMESDGLMNPYSEYGSPYSNKSWTNPYATDAPKLFDRDGNYRGKLSANPYDTDSTSNPYGRFGSPYSADSINNPYGAGNPYSGTQIFVVPSR